MAQAKRMALKSMLQNISSSSVKRVSVENSESYKSLSISLKDKGKSISIPSDMIPEEIIQQKSGRLHISISGKIQSSDKDSVNISISDYSCSLSKEQEVEKSLPA